MSSDCWRACAVKRRVLVLGVTVCGWHGINVLAELTQLPSMFTRQRTDHSQKGLSADMPSSLSESSPPTVGRKVIFRLHRVLFSDNRGWFVVSVVPQNPMPQILSGCFGAVFWCLRFNFSSSLLFVPSRTPNKISIAEIYFITPTLSALWVWCFFPCPSICDGDAHKLLYVRYRLLYDDGFILSYC